MGQHSYISLSKWPIGKNVWRLLDLSINNSVGSKSIDEQQRLRREKFWHSSVRPTHKRHQHEFVFGQPLQ